MHLSGSQLQVGSRNQGQLCVIFLLETIPKHTLSSGNQSDHRDRIRSRVEVCSSGGQLKALEWGQKCAAAGANPLEYTWQ